MGGGCLAVAAVTAAVTLAQPAANRCPAALARFNQTGQKIAAAGYSFTLMGAALEATTGRNAYGDRIGNLARGLQILTFAGPTGAIVFTAIREGRDFEKVALVLLDLEKNTARFESYTMSGAARTVIPDALNMFPGTARAGVWEVKNWLFVYKSSQLQAEANFAREIGVPFNLVVGENTRVFQSVKQMVRDYGGVIYRVVENGAIEIVR